MFFPLTNKGDVKKKSDKMRKMWQSARSIPRL